MAEKQTDNGFLKNPEPYVYAGSKANGSTGVAIPWKNVVYLDFGYGHDGGQSHGISYIDENGSLQRNDGESSVMYKENGELYTNRDVANLMNHAKDMDLPWYHAYGATDDSHVWVNADYVKGASLAADGLTRCVFDVEANAGENAAILLEKRPEHFRQEIAFVKQDFGRDVDRQVVGQEGVLQPGEYEIVQNKRGASLIHGVPTVGWAPNEVFFKESYGPHKFSDDEVKSLLNGEQVPIPGKNTDFVNVQMGDLRMRGHSYFGIQRADAEYSHNLTPELVQRMEEDMHSRNDYRNSHPVLYDDQKFYVFTDIAPKGASNENALDRYYTGSDVKEVPANDVLAIVPVAFESDASVHAVIHGKPNGQVMIEPLAARNLGQDGWHLPTNDEFYEKIHGDDKGLPFVETYGGDKAKDDAWYQKPWNLSVINPNRVVGVDEVASSKDQSLVKFDSVVYIDGTTQNLSFPVSMTPAEFSKARDDAQKAFGPVESVSNENVALTEEETHRANRWDRTDGRIHYGLSLTNEPGRMFKYGIVESHQPGDYQVFKSRSAEQSDVVRGYPNFEGAPAVVNFKRTYGGHTFDDNEISALLNGDTVSVQGRSGKSMTLQLGEVNAKGHPYYGVKLASKQMDRGLPQNVNDASVEHTDANYEK